MIRQSQGRRVAAVHAIRTGVVAAVVAIALSFVTMQSAQAGTWFPAPSAAHGYGVDVSMPPAAFDIVGKVGIPREDGVQTGSIGPLLGYYSYVMCATGVYPVDLVSRNQDGEHYAVANLRASNDPGISYGTPMNEAGHRCTFYLMAPGRTVHLNVWIDWRSSDTATNSFFMAISGSVTT